jgi:NADH-quinone oxidoreductase subunit N
MDMNFTTFLLMRQELLLVILTLFVVIIDLATAENKKHRVINLTLLLFGMITVAGFLPSKEGSLFGGMYNSTLLLVAMKNILNIALLIVLLQSVKWLQKDENRNKTSEYFILLFSTMIGMDFMISSGDFLMFYIGLELATIPATVLVAFDKSRNTSAEAGIKFIFTSALSTGVLLLGLSFIYGTTGSIYFTDVFSAFGSSSLHLLGFIFFLSGMGFKISLVPFHFWAADVYEGAPVNITAYLSVISKGAAVFILTIILYKVFTNITDTWEMLLYVLAVSTMTIANLFAIRQNNLKRFMAFSSIAQAGFILLGIMGASQAGITTVVYFMLIYVFTNLAAFGVISSISHETGMETITSYNGLYRTNPLLSLTMMLALFSLAGIPPVAGFFGKFFLFTAAASRGYYILVLIAVLNATISLYYYLRVIKAMFIDRNDQPIAYFKSDIFTRISLVFCILGVFFIGFFGVVYEYFYKLAAGI